MRGRGDGEELGRALHEPQSERLPVREGARLFTDAKCRQHDGDAERRRRERDRRDEGSAGEPLVLPPGNPWFPRDPPPCERRCGIEASRSRRRAPVGRSSLSQLASRPAEPASGGEAYSLSLAVTANLGLPAQPLARLRSRLAKPRGPPSQRARTCTRP